MSFDSGSFGPEHQAASALQYRMQVHASMSDIPASEWNALLGDSPADQCFSSHEFLLAFETSGSVDSPQGRQGTGWVPRPVTLRNEHERLCAALILYEKWHSYGEYVFDWSWAQAYEQHGRAYYPKLLSAVPFTPVPGLRVAGDPAARVALLNALGPWAQKAGYSSIHLLLPSPALAIASQPGWMQRHGVQFHWHNRGYYDFDAYLADLTQPKRKKIRAERRKVRDAQVRIERVCGGEISEAHWDFFYQCYCRTYAEHHSTPYLTREFFEHTAAALPQLWHMVIAYQNGRPIASSLFARAGARLLGRYWGALTRVDCLHFELAYYQGIEWAIALGLAQVEGGAQGEHKLARGFGPVPTESWHWIADPPFAQAIGRFLSREGPALGAYIDELAERAPFKAPTSEDPQSAN
jgi:predicted N-acyltransferase